MIVFELNRVERVNGHLGFAAGGIELSLLDRIGKIEPAGDFRALVVIFKPGDDLFDTVADVLVVVFEQLPRRGRLLAERGFGDAADDCCLAE